MRKWMPYLVISSIIILLTIPLIINKSIALSASGALVGDMEYDSTKYEYHMITPDSFTELGEWVVDDDTYAFNNTVLKSKSAITSENSAKTVLTVGNTSKAEDYYIWIRSLDYPYYNPGTRGFYINVNGVDYKNSDNESFGKHGTKVTAQSTTNSAIKIFWWEKVSQKINVNAGEKINLSILAEAGYARVDAIIVTNDPNFTPVNPVIESVDGVNKYSYDYTPAKNAAEKNIEALYDKLLEFCKIKAGYQFEEELEFPEYAKQDIEEESDIQEELVIENDNVSLSFRKIKSASTGKNYVQKQTIVKESDESYTVDEYTDGLGWLCLYADSAEALEAIATPVFKYVYEGVSYGSRNSFAGGYPSWIIPSSVEKTADNTIKITGYNDYISLSAFFTLEKDAKEPKITVNFTTKKDGYYSFGMFNSNKEIERSEVKFIQVPYRYQELAIPNEPVMVTETYSTAALTQVTKELEDGKDVTYGMVVDPESIENRWVYDKLNTDEGYDEEQAKEEQANFGLTIVGKDLNVQPGIFAPIMGSEDSKLSKGEMYTFTYRTTTTVSESSVGSWYDNFEHVVTDILGIKDYRKNYFAKMTDTIFNMYKLLKDDESSGWSEDGKANYNMEGQNVVSNADALEYLQMYLLTEDEEIYESRTIPSLEYIISRKSSTFATGDTTNSSSAFKNMFYTSGNYAGMGLTTTGATSGLGNSTYTGAYLMSFGRIPQYRQISSKNILGTYIAQASELGIKNPSEYLWRYKATGEEKYLEQAKEAANTYITERVYGLNDQIPNDSDFIFKTYFPNFSALIELYEITKEPIYLEAAKESARRLLVTLWSTSTPTEDSTTTLTNSILVRAQNSTDVKGKYFLGNIQKRLGYQGDYSILSDIAKNKLSGYTGEIVPTWVVSRTGLGLEQTSTFFSDSKNVIMSTWAPELMRLSELLEQTGEDGEIYETYARNSIVGRFANYPGYYQNEYHTYAYEEDFPYEGPDTTNIYYHHIPVLLATLEDFLFSQAYNWSNELIDFENTRSQGYAWFSNRHYGYTSGKVFEEEDMWLWLKEGLVEIESDDKDSAKQIDWFAARKDGRVSFVFMNEQDTSVSAKVTFGEELNLSGTVNAVLYEVDESSENGYKVETITIKAGEKNAITVPGKTVIAIAFDAENVKKPSYAINEVEEIEYDGATTSMGNTQIKYNMIEDDKETSTYDVNANILQVDTNSYYLYVYSDRSPYQYKEDGTTKTNEDGIKGMTIRYQIEGGEWQGIYDSTYPFEHTIKVEDSTKSINFKIEFKLKDNTTLSNDTVHTLNPYTIQNEEIEIKKNESISMEVISSNSIISYKISDNSIIDVSNENNIIGINAGESLLTVVDDEKTKVVKVSVSEEIDKTAPTLTVKYSTTSSTNQNVEVTIKANEEIQEVTGWTLAEDRLSMSKTYEANKSEEVTVLDLAGNAATVKVSVENIDKISPTLAVEYSTTNPTNQNVIVTIKSDEQIQGIEGWTLSSDEKSLSKTYTANGSEEVTVLDLAGNPTTVKVSVGNIDRTAPTLTVEYSTTSPTNQDVVVTIKSNEQIQGLNGWTLSSDEKSLSKTYTANESENVTVLDLAGNAATVKVSVGNIDKTAPILTVEYSTTDPTNQSVEVTINSDEEIQEVTGWTLSEDKMSLTKMYTGNESETITVLDLAGNSASIQVEVGNQDKTAPTITVKYSTTNPTNQDVVVTIKSNEPIQEITGWTLSSNKKSLSKTYTANGSESVTVLDLAGNETTVEVSVGNIDRTAPTLTVEYSTTSPTNQDVVVIVKSNEQIQEVEGWVLSSDKKSLSKTYTANGIENVTVLDLAGNEETASISVENIDKTAPTLTIEYSITSSTNQNVVVTIKSNEQIQEVTGWTLSSDKKSLSKTYIANGSENITVLDLVGNPATVKVSVENIDKTAPTLNVVYSTTTITNQNVIVTINSNEEIQEINEWTLSSDKKSLSKIYAENESENVTVLDLVGNSTSIQLKVTNIDKIAPKIEGVEDGKTYESVIPNITDENLETIILTKNAQKIVYTNGEKIDTIGEYELVATDKAGNSKKVSFIIELKAKLTSEYYTIDEENKYIIGVTPGELGIDIVAKVKSNVEYKILDKNGEEINSTTKIGTGMIVRQETGETYEIIVKGDVNGDGKISTTDITKLRKHLIKKEILQGCYEKAADTKEDGKITITDLAKLKKALVGIISL